MNLLKRWRRALVAVLAFGALAGGVQPAQAANPGAALCTIEGVTYADGFDGLLNCTGSPDLTGTWQLTGDNGSLTGRAPDGRAIGGWYQRATCTVYAGVIVHECWLIWIVLCEPQGEHCVVVEVYVCIHVSAEVCIYYYATPFQGEGSMVAYPPGTAAAPGDTVDRPATPLRVLTR